jgi:hypothetical protein
MHTKTRALMATIAVFFVAMAQPLVIHAQPKEAEIVTFLKLPKTLQASLKISKVQPLDTLQGEPQPDGTVRVDARLTLIPKEELFRDDHPKSPDLDAAIVALSFVQYKPEVTKYTAGIVIPQFIQKTCTTADRAELTLLLAAVPRGKNGWDFTLIKGFEPKTAPVWYLDKPRSAFPPASVVWGSPEAEAKIVLLQREVVAFQAIDALVQRRWNLEREAAERLVKEIPEPPAALTYDQYDAMMEKVNARNATIEKKKKEAAEKIIADDVAQILAALGPTN